jgi:hypothetical protein
MASVWGDHPVLRSLQMQNGVPWIWLSVAGGLEQLLAESNRRDRDQLLKIIQLYRLDLHDELCGAFGIAEGRKGYQPKNTLMKRFRRIMRGFLGQISENNEQRIQLKRKRNHTSHISRRYVRAA